MYVYTGVQRLTIYFPFTPKSASPGFHDKHTNGPQSIVTQSDSPFEIFDWPFSTRQIGMRNVSNHMCVLARAVL